MAKVKIIINNHRSRVTGSLKIITKLNKTCKLRSSVYFWSAAWRNRQWDGNIRYVTDTGTFMTGYIYQVLEKLKKWNVKYELMDNREPFKPLKEIKKLGNLKGRHYQWECVSSLMNHKIEGIPFRRGILHEATNAGKNLIAAMIVAGFSSKRRSLFLIDNQEIFKQAVRELKELLPREVGQVGLGKLEVDKRLTVAMVQTLSSRASKDYKIKGWLSTIDILIVDECDTVGTRKDSKFVASHCYNASCRVGMSGTPLAHKDKTRNQEVLNFFGCVIHRTTNKELVDWGYSSKPTINFVRGNETVEVPGDYSEEYRLGITDNRKRNKRILRIAFKAVKKGPVVILIKYHKHIHSLLHLLNTKFREGAEDYRVRSVHHETPGRTQIIKDFNKDKIDILIASMIIRRGMNMKRMRSLVNAAGGDSESNVLQLLGRGLRKEEGVKEEIDIWEFFDKGKYLQRHSKHRIRYYKSEGFEVNELYK